MAQTKKLIIDPKKWLGDSKLMKMDWDVRAMHFHLILIAWQADDIGYLEIKDLGKYLFVDTSTEDWKNRIWTQLKTVWKEETKEINGSKVDFIFQAGLIKEIEKQLKPKVIKKKTTVDSLSDIEKKAELKDFYEISQMDDIDRGFSLLSVIDINEIKNTSQNKDVQENTITEEERKQNNHTIWSLGVDLLVNDNFSNSSARAFLSKLAKEYKTDKLAFAIAKMLSQKTLPIDTKGYLIGILKNSNFESNNQNNNFKKHNSNQVSGRPII